MQLHARSTLLLAGLATCIAGPAVAETITYAFTGGGGFSRGHGGANPAAELARDASGTLYLPTESGGPGCGANGPGCGSIFLLTPPAAGAKNWKVRAIAGFKNGSGGGFPLAGVLVNASSTLFGTTSGGGITNGGTGFGIVYKVTPPASGSIAWTKTILWRFKSGADGQYPRSRLVAGADGVLYGTTELGGTKCGVDANDQGCGIVFSLTPPAAGKTAWQERVLYRFKGGDDGAKPFAGLLIDAQGALYGTAQLGGTPQGSGAVFGIIYKLTPPAPGHTAWTETVLHSFTSADGAYPESELVADASGALYGTTYAGGEQDVGTVFELTPPSEPAGIWHLHRLHSFVGGKHDGSYPNSKIVITSDGSLVGTTPTGGAASLGEVYKLTLTNGAWRITQLYSFLGGPDAASPQAGLLPDEAGNLFGASFIGGAGCPAQTTDGCGTVYEVTP